MKYLRLIFVIALAHAMCSCGAKNTYSTEAKHKTNELAQNDSVVNSQNYSDIIKTVYDKFVFAIEADPDVYAHPEQFFTANALNKLKDSYEFDCENGDCYAYYELRTQEQDSKPGSNEESEIISIEGVGDNWYIVKYSDMGWSGMTRIKISDGKIDDYQRCVEDL